MYSKNKGFDLAVLILLEGTVFPLGVKAAFRDLKDLACASRVFGEVLWCCSEGFVSKMGIGIGSFTSWLVSFLTHLGIIVFPQEQLETAVERK